jgi:hypothetical protein
MRIRLHLGGMMHGHVFTGRSVGRQGGRFLLLFCSSSFPPPPVFSRVLWLSCFFSQAGSRLLLLLIFVPSLPTTAPSELLIKLPGNDASLCVCLRCWPLVPWLFVAINFVGLAQAAWNGVGCRYRRLGNIVPAANGPNQLCNC